MSMETEMTKLRSDVDHLAEKVDQTQKLLEEQGDKLDRLFEMFTMGKGIVMFVVKGCLFIGALASAGLVYLEKIAPHIIVR